MEGRLRFLKKHCEQMLKSLPESEVSLRTFWQNALNGFDKRIKESK